MKLDHDSSQPQFYWCPAVDLSEAETCRWIIVTMNVSSGSLEQRFVSVTRKPSVVNSLRCPTTSHALQPPKGVRAVQASSLSPRLRPGGSRFLEGVRACPGPQAPPGAGQEIRGRSPAPREGQVRKQGERSEPRASAASEARSPWGPRPPRSGGWGRAEGG